MINKNEPLSMAEAAEYAKNANSSKDLQKFMKEFAQLKNKDALELRKKLEELNLMKLKNQQIVKIIDLMPEDNEDLNKIFVDIKLDEDESKKILDVVKEFN